MGPDSLWGRRCALLALLFLVALASPYRAGAQDESTLSLAAYWELVAATETEVGGLTDADAAETRASLAPLAARWESVRQVRLPEGDLIPVAHERIVALLRADEPDLAAISGHLAALSEARRAWPDTIYSEEKATRLRTHLEEILARPAFQWRETEPTLLQRIWQRILRALFDLLPAGRGSPILNYALTGLGALALLAVLLYAARSFFASFTSEAEREGATGPESELTAEEALTRAHSLSRDGDYRAAVRYLYLSTLLLLDERGVLRYDRSRTNREYLGTVRDRPEVAATLRSVVEVFDRTWYGYQPLDAESYAAYEAAVNALKEMRGKP